MSSNINYMASILWTLLVPIILVLFLARAAL